MKQIYILLVLFLLYTMPTSAQKCELTSSKFPALRGFSLGMKQTDIEKTYPKLKFNDTLNFFYPNAKFATISANELLPQFRNDVDVIQLGFLNKQLIDLEISYSIVWDDLKEFGTKIKQSLNLPVEFEYNSIGIILCRDFSISISLTTDSRGKLSVSNIFEKNVEDEEKRKKNFRP